MVLGALVAAATVGSSLYDYNLENFKFDKGQQQERTYMGQEMRLKQFELYREDVRDLVELTVAKMDNYMIVNALMLVFSVLLFTEGRPEVDGPTDGFLIWLFTICNAGACLFFCLSVWLAMHASISAHSFGVRLLTQFVRLPVPNKKEIEQAQGQYSQFEGASVGTFFRVPVLKQQMQALSAAMANSSPSGADAQGIGSHDIMSDAAMRQHVRLYRELQNNWQAYDAYTRVSMYMGANQLCHALAYYCLIVFLQENKVPVPGMACALIITWGTWLLTRLDLYVSRRSLVTAAVLLIVPVVLAMIVETVKVAAPSVKWITPLLLPASFALHLLWIAYVTHCARGDIVEDGVALPSKFRSVLYLDVFGWRTDAPARAPAPSAARGMADNALSAVPEATFEDTQMRGEATEFFANQMSEVGESIRSGSMLGRSSVLSTKMHASLGAVCWRLQSELRVEIRSWEKWQSDDVPQFINDVHRARVREANERFEAIVSQLARIDPDSPEDYQDDSQTGDRGSPDVWLRFEWSPSGHAMEIFYNPSNGKTSWERPGSAIVSSFKDVEEKLATFADKVGALTDGDPDQPRRIRSKSMNSMRSKRSFSSLPRQGTSQSFPNTATVAEDPWFERRRRQVVRALTPEGSNPTAPQQSRFGGDEATVLENQALRQDFFAHSPAAGVSFYPHRVSTQVRGRRSPGQMPWRTVLYGSIVLCCVWFGGLLWAMLKTWYQIDVVLMNPDAGDKLEVDLLFDEWPSLFDPTGLACDHHLGNSMLILNRYSVHRLELTDGSMHNVLTECLELHPRFQAQGLQGASVECGSHCTVVLLAVTGATLQCNLTDLTDLTAVHHGAESWSRSEANEVPVWGGPWQASTGGFGSFWALRDGSLVQLERTSRGYLPSSEIALRSTETVSSMHVGDEVLGLDGKTLHVWAPWSFREAARSYKLIANVPDVSWSALCATDSQVYLLGREHGRLGLWRTRLPTWKGVL